MDRAEQGKDERKFKGESECKDKKGAEGDILSHRDHRLHLGRLVAQQESNTKRQRHKVAEKGPEIEKQDGSEENECGRSRAPDAKRRGKRGPSLVKDDRHGAKETGEEREFDDGEEGLRDTERNEIRSKVHVSKVTKQDLGKGEEDHPQHKESDEDFK